jgi:hypothetical protein
MRIQQKHLRAVLSGPIELGGGCFTPLYVTAGSGYVLHFLKNWRTSTEDIGKQLRITCAWSAFQAGVYFPLLEEPHIELNYIKGKVIPATRKYLADIEGKIVLLRHLHLTTMGERYLSSIINCVIFRL